MRRSQLAAVTAMALIPCLSVAWWPGGPESVPPYPYGPGVDGPPPVQSAPPSWPGTALPAGPQMPPPGMSDQIPPRVRLDIARRILDDAYLVDIRVAGLDPDQVLVRPAGRGLMVGYSMQRWTDRSDTLPDGAGYRTSRSLSLGTVNRRLALPPDADLSRLSREVRDGHLLIRVPRMQIGPGGWPMAPPAYWAY